MGKKAWIFALKYKSTYTVNMLQENLEKKFPNKHFIGKIGIEPEMKDSLLDEKQVAEDFFRFKKIQFRRQFPLDQDIKAGEDLINSIYNISMCTNSKNVKLIHYNTQGILNKIVKLKNYFLANGVDLCCFTEHWLKTHEILLINFSNYFLVSNFYRSIYAEIAFKLNKSNAILQWKA